MDPTRDMTALELADQATEHEMGELAQSLQALSARLEPVLRPLPLVNSANGGCAESPAPMASPVVMAMHAKAHWLREIKQGIFSLLDRLEV